MNELLSLRSLSTGQTAEVGEITGDPEQVHRLQELGFRRGSTVEMLQPGSPCIIRLSGQKLCFRNNGALNILVRPAGAHGYVARR
jgi:Fe2+ transport system protein FeoA